MTSKQVITIYDSSKALFFDRNLAERYQIHGKSLEEICRHNASVAYDAGYPDLGKLWLLASKFELVQHSEDKAILDNHLKKINKVRECQLKYSEKILCSCAKPDLEELIGLTDGAKPVFKGSENGGLPWALHPMGQQMLHRFLETHSQVRDFQTVAVLSSIFTQTIPDLPNPPPPSPKKKTSSNYQNSRSNQKKTPPAVRIVTPASIPAPKNEEIGHEASEGISASFQPDGFLGLFSGASSNGNVNGGGNSIKRIRSNSDVSASIDEFTSLLTFWYKKGDQNPDISKGAKVTTVSPIDNALTQNGEEENTDPAVSIHRDENGTMSEINGVLYLKKSSLEILTDLKEMYSDMLLRNGLFVKSAEILKTIDRNFNKNDPADKNDREENKLSLLFPYAKTCGKCSTKFSGSKCLKCDESNDLCCVCGLRIRGLSAYCTLCGHGGHYKHIKSYFQQGLNICASIGCGCNCTTNANNFT